MALENNLYNQKTDILAIEHLFSHLKSRTFVDIGAEKGNFAAACFSIGFSHGVLCEPLPKHFRELSNKGFGSKAVILPFAIDADDGICRFYIASDEAGRQVSRKAKVDNRAPQKHGIHFLSPRKLF